MLSREPPNKPNQGGREASPRPNGPAKEAALRRALECNDIGDGTFHVLFQSAHDLIFGLVVEGKESLRTWSQLHCLREDTGFSPVIIGGRKEAADLVENVLERWKSTSPLEILKRVREVDPRAWLDGRFSNPHRFLEARWKQLGEGRWSEDVPKHSVEMIQELKTVEGGGFQSPTLKDDVIIALVPTTRSVHGPAHLKFGNVHDCPHPVQHVALLEYWNERYGLELIGMTADSMALQVRNPPTRRAEVYRLAQDLFTYTDGDGWSEQTRRGIASSLMKGRVWSLWWE